MEAGYFGHGRPSRVPLPSVDLPARRSEITSRSSSTDSSVTHCSPAPTTFCASARLLVIISSMRSSIVPLDTSLWT